MCNLDYFLLAASSSSQAIFSHRAVYKSETIWKFRFLGWNRGKRGILCKWSACTELITFVLLALLCKVKNARLNDPWIRGYLSYLRKARSNTVHLAKKRRKCWKWVNSIFPFIIKEQIYWYTHTLMGDTKRDKDFGNKCAPSSNGLKSTHKIPTIRPKQVGEEKFSTDAQTHW